MNAHHQKKNTNCSKKVTIPVACFWKYSQQRIQATVVKTYRKGNHHKCNGKSGDHARIKVEAKMPAPIITSVPMYTAPQRLSESLLSE